LVDVRATVCVKVKLVVVDSVAFHFRQDFDDYLLRSRLLAALAQTLNRLVAKHNVAVSLHWPSADMICGRPPAYSILTCMA